MKSVRRWVRLGFMSRLARDARGNALAMMAALLIPLTGLVGGGIDISRMYITKTRLQHACDAGALAGRKAMGGGTWAQTVNGTANYPRTTAEKFFDANFEPSAYGMTPGSSASLRSFSESAGKVTGTASAVLPMTLMKVFQVPTQTLTVTCSTEMRLPNTDIMFVLDTTGSMASPAVATDADTKIVSLKKSVKCFYEIVARLDTDATCTTGTPSGGTGSQTQIRFGFMPYSTNVNVGKLLPPSYFADNWKYQSRMARWWVVTKTKTSTKNISQGGVPQSSCTDEAAAAAGYNSYSETFSGSVTSPPFPNGTKRNVKRTDTKVTGWNNNVCYGTQTSSDTDYELRENVTPAAADEWEDWHYGQITQKVLGLKNGTQWNDTFSLPIGSNGTARTITWDGCIEERQTTRAASYSPIPAAAKDLDIDSAPTSDTTTQWGPALQQVIYPRQITTAWNQVNTAETYTETEYYNNIPYYCPTQARKLQTWPAATDFDDYVDSLQPSGNTYHDIGMLWGARFLSPTGIFRSENELTPQGGEIQRHLIFMTDGDAVSAPCDYTAYGVAWFDKRTTTDVGDAANCPVERSQLDDQINARLVALCTAVKNKNIILWVISFGNGSNTTTETRLSDCASPGRYFTARDSAALQTTFQSIANQISQLRLTQ